MSHAILRPLVCLFALVLLATPVLGLESQGAKARPVRVAVFVDKGTCGDKIVALFRALAASGCQPLGVEIADLTAGRLNKANFDVFVLPAGEDGSPVDYWDPNNLGNYENWKWIEQFVEDGGGVVGIESGASFLSYLRIGNVSSFFIPSFPQPGLQDFAIVDRTFGKGSQMAYVSGGGGYFKRSSAVTVASDTLGRPALIRYRTVRGRVVLCSFDPELRGDSELDWTMWDKWDLNGVHPNSEGCWILLGRMVRWAASGNSAAPEINATNPTGVRVALVTTHTANGGPSPSLQPAFARAIESAGHIPLAIRFQDICNGYLTTNNFQVAAFPGGTVGGYSYGLWGYEDLILNFVYQGGSYYGVCAGAYYASAYMVWEGYPYDVPLLGLFPGTDTGPLTEIAAWPNWALTPVQISDPVLGDMGTQQQMYYGGGWKSLYPDVNVAAIYAAPGLYYGLADGIRFSYGSGRVFLSGTHPEARPGSSEDWLYWDNWLPGTNTPVSDPDNPWTYVQAIFNKWLVQ
jgi:glutamine amidotransferase-like uncharacterized protein